MKLYHATTVCGLKILNANSLNREGMPVLYVTDNYPYSLFYIRDREIDFVTCGVGDHGLVHYDEKFPGQLDTLYRGLQGWVYEVEAEAIPTHINGIYVIQGKAEVTASTFIPDAWNAIQSEIRKGNVKLLAYEELTEEQKALNKEGIIRLLHGTENMPPKRMAFFRAHFSDAWDEACDRRKKSDCVGWR